MSTWDFMMNCNLIKKDMSIINSKLIISNPSDFKIVRDFLEKEDASYSTS